MSLFDKFKKSKKDAEQENAAQREKHICPKCGGEMHLQKGLTHPFICRGVPVDVTDITAMVCDDCGKMYFDWDEVERIREVVWGEMKPLGVDGQIVSIE